MKDENATVVASDLYTAEASESRRKAQVDVAVPDPAEEDAQKAIAANVVSEAEHA